MKLLPLWMILSSKSEHVADTVHAAAGHAAEHASEGAPELPNVITLTNQALNHPTHGVVHWLHTNENIVFAFFILFVMCAIALYVYRNQKMIPGRLQAAVEMLVDGLSGFFIGVVGEQYGPKYVAFLGTLFIYILLMNFAGLIPGLHSSTSSVNTTAALAICVFLHVQGSAIRHLGIGKWFFHLMGEPRDVYSWVLVPINLPIHIIGELAKPFSLALRLFGNITGEDVLIAAFVGLGVMIMAVIHSPVGLPLHVPFIFLALLTSTIQALVFSLLAAVYFSLMLPHEHHESEEH
ncbi:MAG: F0F1 ATP synthase subunit A [Candidatus Zixiibacteriota bacterium]